MAWANAQRIESAVDVAAAAAFAAAVAFALGAAADHSGPILAATTALASATTWAGLRRVPVEEAAFTLPAFRLSPIEACGPAATTDELLLDDPLAGVEPEARVVQLFGSAQPRGAEHRRPSPPPDASEALSDALAQLRRSLH